VIEQVSSPFSYNRDIEIDGYLTAIDAEIFPYHPFQPVTYYRSADFATRRNADAGSSAGTRQNEDQKVWGMYFPPILPDPEVFPPIAKSQIGRKPMPGSAVHLLGRDGWDQNFTAFSPAALDNEASVFVLHPCTETMRSLATNSARLIRTFHLLRLLPLDIAKI
jgi:hypothetical protein